MKQKIINLLKKIGLGFKALFSKKTLLTIKALIARFASFLTLLVAYLVMIGITRFTSSKYCPASVTNKILPVSTKAYFKIVELNNKQFDTINRVNLIELAIKNMQYKMTRTIITIGGMSVGIAAIVFLVSVGYGLQDLVTSRVARLEEMRQADITVQPGSNTKITDEALAKITNLNEVKHALPLIAIVGKVNYKNSETDMAVYGVTKEYLDQSAIKPTRGKSFESNDLSYKQAPDPVLIPTGQVAGAKSSAATEPGYDKKIRDVEFEVYPEEWITIRAEPNTEAEIIGYTKRFEGQQTAIEVWGDTYSDPENGNVASDPEGRELGKWIKGNFYAWEQDERKFEKILNEQDQQVQKEGYIAEVVMTVKGINIIEPPAVLGIQDSAVLADTDEVEESTQSTEAAIVELEDGWVLIEDESIIGQTENIQKVELAKNAEKQAVVNRAMLKVLGIEENKAVGETFEVSFIVTSDLLEDGTDKIESIAEEYTIVGVIPPDDTPLFYVPFIDLRSLGVVSYSQVKMVVNRESQLADARKKVEAMGFVTSSVADTVDQIDRLFGTIRKVLAIIGAVALIVAALGMFNTLTVSLLERTREIGLMKAMGMKSVEVQELFLTESMVMGFFGGLLGIFLGWVAGKGLGLLLTVFALSKGVGYIDISYIPPSFTLLIIMLSLVVGLITGIYPAKRATTISALNALRYE